METRHLKVNFDHGRFHAPFYSPRNYDSIVAAMNSTDVVVNMVGKYYETGNVLPTKRANGKNSTVNYSYKEVNVDVARSIAKAARETGATTMIHVSSIAADPDSPSEWARTKYEGEEAVREEFPTATILRPCTLFGPEDRFLNWFATVANMPGGLVPLVEDGANLLQPVYVHDVAKAMMKVVEDSAKYAGLTMDLGGPAEYTRRELAEFTFDITKQQATLIDVPAFAAHYAAYAIDFLPDPIWCPNDVALDQVDQTVVPETANLTFADLGITPTPIEKIAFSYLHRYREGGHFIIAKGYHG